MSVQMKQLICLFEVYFETKILYIFSSLERFWKFPYLVYLFLKRRREKLAAELTEPPRGQPPVCPPPVSLWRGLRPAAAGPPPQTESPAPSSACSCQDMNQSFTSTPRCRKVELCHKSDRKTSQILSAAKMLFL